MLAKLSLGYGFVKMLGKCHSHLHLLFALGDKSNFKWKRSQETPIKFPVRAGNSTTSIL